MFGCSYLGDGNASSNVQSVTGQNGTFVQGMNYNYLYGQGPDSYVDIIGANGGTMLFKSQDNNGRAISYNGAGGSYRAIHSAFIFGALRDGTQSKTGLMASYMDYLTELIGVEELVAVSVQNLLLSPNPTTGISTVSFGLAEPGELSVKIYNTVGQLVRDVLHTELARGNHTVVWDGRDNNGRELGSGTYILKVQLDRQIAQKAIVLVR